MTKLFLIAFVLAVAADQTTEKPRNYCERDADCSKDDDRCLNPGAVCECVHKAWCSIKYRCDPVNNGAECPSYAKNCFKRDGENEYFCVRKAVDSPPGTLRV
ncbi:unnamed protein product, partial [Mesorhabditis belari]|uniref:Uncharacterized protein n=1 Tax=Mesorhabditis belari TaxID=2138241 RepID=A0AAF3EDL8_9BILA